jgi:hypothetical protein
VTTPTPLPDLARWRPAVALWIPRGPRTARAGGQGRDLRNIGERPLDNHRALEPRWQSLEARLMAAKAGLQVAKVEASNGVECTAIVPSSPASRPFSELTTRVEPVED